MRLKSHFTKAEPLYDNSSTPIETPDLSSLSQTQSQIRNNRSTRSHQTFPLDRTAKTDDKYPQFKPKSSWEPPKQSVVLETFLHNVEFDVASSKSSKETRNNLTKDEKQALRSLKHNTDIVIKPADKGSAVVVMDRDHYISEAERQLSDTKFYKALDNDPTHEFQRKVTTTLTKMVESGDISDSNFNYLSVQNPKPGRFYLLPKIHKPGNPGRPIVSANGHPTEHISEFIDLHLRPFVTELPSYVQDTTDYLKKIDSKTMPDNTLLVSMDVTSLYTNIPHDDGITACRDVWDSRETKDPPTETLLELLTLVLKCNNFEFNGRNYIQLQGTAMGTKMAPSYANIFMGRLEGQLLMSVPLQPYSWLRFIDDIDMQWCHGHQNLKHFLESANSFHQSIKFTSEISNDEHIFLDTISHIENDKLITDLYSKPTDTHQYLLPTSCHPKHCCKNIPYSLALRVRRICTQKSDFDHRASELSEHLCRRGYKQSSVSQAVQKVSTLERADLLQYNASKTPKPSGIPFVTTFHPDLPDIRSTIDHHWSRIESSSKLSKIFPEKPILAYRRPKSLKDILVNSKIAHNGTNEPTGHSAPCNTSRCLTCKIMCQTHSFNSKSGAISSIRGTHNCKSSNVVYLITCNVCQKQYVGETIQALNRRINLHRSDWHTRKFNRAPVAEHFHEIGHSFDNIELCCIEANEQWTDEQRKARETYWIRRLNTVQPHGINKSDT